METIISIMVEAVICTMAVILSVKVYRDLSVMVKDLISDMSIRMYNKRQGVTILSEEEFNDTDITEVIIL